MVIPVEVREVIGRFFSNPEVLLRNLRANCVPYYSWSYTQSISYLLEENEF